MPKEVKKKVEGEVVDLKEKTTVYSTDKDPHHETGEEMSVHPKVAEKLIKKGLATEKPVGKKAEK